jgi:hypothetical protein
MNGTDVTLAMARVLLERGADPDTKARLGNLPLTDCVSSNKIDFIKLLLEFGVMHFGLWQYIYSPPPPACFFQLATHIFDTIVPAEPFPIGSQHGGFFLRQLRQQSSPLEVSRAGSQRRLMGLITGFQGGLQGI